MAKQPATMTESEQIMMSGKVPRTPAKEAEERNTTKKDTKASDVICHPTQRRFIEAWADLAEK